MNPFFPELPRGVNVPLENCLLRFSPKMFVPCPANRLGFRRLYIPKHTASLLRILQGNRAFSITFLQLLVGLTVNLFVPECALFAEFASRI